MNTSYFENKLCFITGAASGIGKAVALQLAQYGGQLILTDIRQEALDQTVLTIQSKNGKVLKHRAFDISDFEAVQTFSDEVQAEFGAMDIIMNIAGIAIWGAIDKMKHEEWKKVIDINLMGPIHVIESFVPKMMEQQSGHIVNVSSAAGLFPLPWHGAYSASKYGLRGLSDVMRHDLKRYHIHTHLVCPGAVDTGLVHDIKISGVDTNDDKLRQLKGEFQKYAVSPEQAANAIITGVLKKRYYIFTSQDIRFGLWGQQKFNFIYNRVMQKMNDFFQNTINKN